MLPAFETVRRLRPVDLVAPDAVQVDLTDPDHESLTPCPQPAPSAAVEVDSDGPAELRWVSGDVSLIGGYDGSRVRLQVRTGTRTTEHRSRRFGRPSSAVSGLALTLTGGHLTAFTREDGGWVARARVDLADRHDPRVDTHDEEWLAGLHVGHHGHVHALRAGGFGQLGLRDLRVVTEADGTAYLRDGRILLTATSAGPGFFDTAHTSVWSLDPETLDLAHRSDLFFRRRGGVYADHATHLLHEPSARSGAADDWLVATSTWGDFPQHRDRHTRAHVGVTVAHTDADLLTGRHVLDGEPLRLPTDGLRSVGVWDPHLVREGDTWLVGYVSARRYFDFHPVVATGPSLDALTLRAAAPERRATEGTTLAKLDEEWRVLASDGRDNPRRWRARYPIFDLDLREIDRLRSAYRTNLPWPTLVRVGDRWLHVAFNGAAYGGSLLGYGTHGAVVISRSVPA